MVIVDLQTILPTEPRIVAGELQFWGDVGEDRKDQLVWESEDYENGMRWIDVRSEEVMRELVLRLVWGAGLGDRPMAGWCFLPRPDASRAKNVGEFSPWRLMILLTQCSLTKYQGEGEGVTEARVFNEDVSLRAPTIIFAFRLKCATQVKATINKRRYLFDHRSPRFPAQCTSTQRYHVGPMVRVEL